MSCRHLTPRGRNACYFPSDTHTRTHNHTNTLQVLMSLCKRSVCSSLLLLLLQLLCLCLYVCVCVGEIWFALSWCCLSISPLVLSCSGWFYIEATDMWGHTHTHTPTSNPPTHAHAHSHTHTIPDLDPQLIDTETW